LANSAQFGLPRGVSSLDDAITMVGMSRVRTLALGACFSESFPTIPGLDREEFWRTSMACAGYAQWLATGLGMDGQQAWLTGMMLRLGELLIVKRSRTCCRKSKSCRTSPVCAGNVRPGSPALPKAKSLQSWHVAGNFPPQMVQALARSAEPVTTHGFSRLAGVVHLAGLMAETDRRGGPNAHRIYATDVISALDAGHGLAAREIPQRRIFCKHQLALVKPAQTGKIFANPAGRQPQPANRAGVQLCFRVAGGRFVVGASYRCGGQ